MRLGARFEFFEGGRFVDERKGEVVTGGCRWADRSIDDEYPISSVETVEIDSRPRRDRFLLPLTTGSTGPKASSGGESSATGIGSCADFILSTICLVFDLRASALSARNDGTDGRLVRDLHSRSSFLGAGRIVCRRVGKLMISSTGGDGDGDGDMDSGEWYLAGVGTKEDAVALKGLREHADTGEELWCLALGVMGKGSESADNSESVRSALSRERMRSSRVDELSKHESQ